MSRMPRLFVDNACYHIITRGNHKQPVFRKENDYAVYIRFIRKAKIRYNIRIYAYCLMPNHVHLLIDPVSSKTISRFMHWVNLNYAMHFNNIYKTDGHLWQGRFKSKLINRDRYLLTCISYIEANPVRASMVSDLLAYKWTSYYERYSFSRSKILDEWGQVRSEVWTRS